MSTRTGTGESADSRPEAAGQSEKRHGKAWEVMATLRQVEAATTALGLSWAQILEVCREDLAKHGVLSDAQIERLERPGAYRLGDVVAVRGHGRYRAARVWKVSRRSARVSAMYLTPSSLAESRVHPPTLCNSTAIPAGLVPAATHSAPHPLTT